MVWQRHDSAPQCHEATTTQRHCCRLIFLQPLTLNRDNAVVIGSRGGIAALLEICRVGTPSAQADAAAVLKNLATVQDLWQNFLEENGVPVLIGGLESGIWNPSCPRECGDRGEYQNLEPGIGLLRIFSSFTYIVEIIATTGFLPRIITALERNKPGTRTEATRAIVELGLVVGRTRKEFEDAVHRLLLMLEVKAVEEKEAAARALASLMAVPGYQRLLRKEEKGIVNVV
ncbi:hypothetical protein Cni_G11151 [Canna indica]|uniref:ARM repeat superfamily protein n=1 Tax=Canna indica TaxID=4628 RepID=A0AAQ3K9N5_9LILI|nr:hypothetical protein Cni_G11151 [Canna indica]